ncbi:hypothetical protein G7Y89_g9605 [Cudoniella acicularis]|uniref:1,3-beta-glucanosyltransferase n=1 Tax=Cudoniella acicularis TaxID=354080 RepID=A0A8H4REC1_9HELO|nr:hypothetical protein G7Y89_g9605 [Cudoniella acicularis]
MWARIVKFCLALQTAIFLSAIFVDATLDPIVIVGSRFFFKTNGSEFFIRGVAYQQSSETSTIVDPLADQAGCQRDIPYLQALRTNVVHVYAVDSTQDHSACMSLLDAAGIYVLVDLPTPSAEIDRAAPTWTWGLYTSYASVIDSVQNFTNVLGFFVGNEVDGYWLRRR